MSETPTLVQTGTQSSYQVTLAAEAGEAEAIASRLEAAVEPEALAVSLFDRGDGRFEVSALYAERPREDALVMALGGAAHGAFSIEQLAPVDWVTLTEAACPNADLPLRLTQPGPSAPRITPARAAASLRSMIS
jgi:hypothetical protein